MTGASKILRALPQVQAVNKLRNAGSSFASSLGASEATCDALALVIDELFNNALEHGVSYRRGGKELTFTISDSAGRIRLDFVDAETPAPVVTELAAAFDAAANGMPALDSERGRGLFLVAIHLERLVIRNAEGGGLHLSGLITASG